MTKLEEKLAKLTDLGTVEISVNGILWTVTCTFRDPPNCGVVGDGRSLIQAVTIALAGALHARHL